MPVILTFSVPQGSVVGPNKFVAYTEDIAEKIDTFAISHHIYTGDKRNQSHMGTVDAHASRLNIKECGVY